MYWIGSSGKMGKGLDSSNGSEKTAAVATAEMLTGLGGNGGGDKMKATEAAQDWLVIRRPQQQDNGDCGSKGGGANLAWLGSSGKTARQKKNQQQNGSDIINGVRADWTRRKWQFRSSGRQRKLSVTIAAK